MARKPLTDEQLERKRKRDRERALAWRTANREKYREQCRAWTAKNPELRREINKRSREKHIDQQRAYDKRPERMARKNELARLRRHKALEGFPPKPAAMSQEEKRNRRRGRYARMTEEQKAKHRARWRAWYCGNQEQRKLYALIYDAANREHVLGRKRRSMAAQRQAEPARCRGIQRKSYIKHAAKLAAEKRRDRVAQKADIEETRRRETLMALKLNLEDQP